MITLNDLDLFQKFLYEAPGDDPPPDIGGDVQEADTGPPDLGSEEVPTDESPPDMDGLDADMGGDFGGDSPPDIGDFGDGEFDDGESQNPDDTMELDEKISAIMNQRLYQEFLSLLNTITTQISSVKENTDILRSISPDSLDIVKGLKKLDENLHLYLKNNFMYADYSKNLLFFNECLNLLKLLNNIFDRDIHKGIKDIK